MHQWFDSAVQALIAVLALCALVISGIALIPGFMALKRAREANQLASGANVIASGANALSAQANQVSIAAHELARGADARATETHDVEWHVGYRDESAYLLINEGFDTAYGVRAYIKSEGGPRGVLSTETTAAPWQYVDVPAALDTALVRGFIDLHPVRVRVHWRSASGTPHTWSVTLDGADVVRRNLPLG